MSRRIIRKLHKNNIVPADFRPGDCKEPTKVYRAWGTCTDVISGRSEFAEDGRWYGLSGDIMVYCYLTGEEQPGPVWIPPSSFGKMLYDQARTFFNSQQQGILTFCYDVSVEPSENQFGFVWTMSVEAEMDRSDVAKKLDKQFRPKGLIE